MEEMVSLGYRKKSGFLRIFSKIIKKSNGNSGTSEAFPEKERLELQEKVDELLKLIPYDFENPKYKDFKGIFEDTIRNMIFKKTLENVIKELIRERKFSIEEPGFSFYLPIPKSSFGYSRDCCYCSPEFPKTLLFFDYEVYTTSTINKEGFSKRQKITKGLAGLIRICKNCGDFEYIWQGYKNRVT